MSIAKALLALLPVLSAPPSGCASERIRYEFQEPHMGTRFRIVCYAPASLRAEVESTAARALAAVEALEQVFSDYREDSEARRLCEGPAGEWQEVSEELWRLTLKCQRLSVATGGAFDVTVGPFVQLWRRGARQGRLPSREELEKAAYRAGFTRLEVDPARPRVRLSAEGMRLDYGAIAKGHAADRALAMFQTAGLEQTLVDAGGDIAAGSAPPGRRFWTIALSAAAPGEPDLLLPLVSAALATSGDTERFLEVDGRRYSHILDPTTGLGLTDRWLVTVLAPDGRSADALASAVSVMGPARGLAWVETLPDTEVLMRSPVDPSKTFASTGFPAMMAPAGPAAAR